MEKKIKIPIIAVLIIAIISIGIAFAAFSSTLNIRGAAQIDASSWNIVFEGLTNTNTLDAPVEVGTGSEITHPTIKNNATEISDYEVSLKSPGDSVTYNFKIHNRGDYYAKVSNVIMNQGINLTSNQNARTNEASTLNAIDYRFYYTDNNQLVGSGDSKDCLAPGDEENVTLRIVFSSSSETSTDVLPSEDIVLDNLGINLIYTQVTSCSSQGGGGNTGGGSDPSSSSPTPTITSSTSGGGVSTKAPTGKNGTISGAKVKLNKQGALVNYKASYTLDTCDEIEGVRTPTLEEIQSLNSNVSPSLLQNILITVTDEEGNSVTGLQIPANSTKSFNIAIQNVGEAIAGIINVPPIEVTFKGECTEPEVSYAFEAIRTDNYEDFTWESNSSSLTNDNVYFKKTGGIIKPCVNVNGDELCVSAVGDFLDDYDTVSNELLNNCISKGAFEAESGKWHNKPGWQYSQYNDTDNPYNNDVMCDYVSDGGSPIYGCVVNAAGVECYYGIDGGYGMEDSGCLINNNDMISSNKRYGCFTNN